MKHEFRLVQNCPVGKSLAPYIAILANDAHAVVNSIYRGVDAEGLLNNHGKSSQRQLYEAFLAGHGNPANPPGFSTHEQKSDAFAYPSVPRGHDLAWWQVGFDVNDSDVPHMIRAAARYGWKVFQPYHSAQEFHHLNFSVEPKPTRRTFARILRLRLTLPRR